MKKGNEKKTVKDSNNKDIKKNQKKFGDKKNEKVEKNTAKKDKHYIAEKKNKTKKEKKENIFKRIAKYFKGVGKEIKRIRWTDRKDLFKYSICTLVFVLFFGIYFYAIDWIVLLVRSLAK